MSEQEALTKETELLDKLISEKSELITLSQSKAYATIIKAFNEEKLSALQDYLKENSAYNQAYAKLWNFLCNMLEIFKDPTELENLLQKKDDLMEQLSKIKGFEQEQSFEHQSGGAV